MNFKEVVVVDKAEKIKKRSAKKKKQSPKKTPYVNEQSTVREDAMQKTNEIPKFDLSEQIMAEQRKITAIKRKGPGKMARPPKKQHPAESIGRNVMPRPILSGPEQIIAEIVARDIEDLCIRNTPSVF